VITIMGVAGGVPAAGQNLGVTNDEWANRLDYAGIAVEEPGYHVWGSSPIIGPNGKTHLFVARWPVSAGFRPGWYTHCEIARYVGEDPEGPFSFREVVLKGTGEPTWDKVAPHNPTVHKVGDRYALLYIANSGTNFPASQQIGMVTAESLSGPWEKINKDGLLLSPPKDPSIWSHNSMVGVNNPALLQHPDGRLFLYYKAMRRGDVRRFGAAIAEELEGPYLFEAKPLTRNKGMIEDAYVFVEEGRIHLLTTDNPTGAGLLWSSRDGIHFESPTLGFDRMDRYIPNQTVMAATNYRERKFERPQVLLQNRRPTHLYAASGANIRKGDGSCSYVFRIREANPKHELDVGDEK
jgi:hypothetical protein